MTYIPDYHIHSDEPEELLNHTHVVEEMAKYLSDHGAMDAARETEDLFLILRHTRMRIEARQKRLYDVWLAVMKIENCNWGPDSLQEALKKYRGEIEPKKE